MSLRGIQTPRVQHIPPARYSLGEDAIELAALAGLHLDPWQQLVLRGAMGEDEDAKWAAFRVGLIVSRQNGKGSILEARELHAMYLEPDAKLILHSSHEFKDLALDTPVLTTGGWSTMGALTVGDEVYAPDGQPTKVIGAHRVLRDSRLYRVTFADGQSFVAGAGHLWALTQVARNGQRVERVVTTEQVRQAGLVHTYPGADRVRRAYQWRAALPAPVQAPWAALPVDPYLLGYWLGAGAAEGGRLHFGVQDAEHVLRSFTFADLRQDPRTAVWTGQVPGLTTELRELGLLGAKRIPPAYLTAHEHQRRELLAGVMDSDGAASGHRLAVTTVNEDLMRDVLQLVRSLGYRATLREFRARPHGRAAGAMWRVQFSPHGGNPFKLARKRANVRTPARPTRALYNAVVAVEPTLTRPTRCITVAHESGCYLVGEGFAITHNTSAEAFLRVKALIDNTDALRKKVKRIRTSHGEEGIELLDGTRLRFIARSTGSGRGFSGDLVILDEAYNLPAATMAALMPTLSAKSITGNPQLWFTSSAGMAQPMSDQLRRIRDQGRSDEATRLAYFEWSAHEDAQLDDRHAWAQANPALGIRISEDYIETERETMQDGEFARERLGIWEDDSSVSVIDWEKWVGCADPTSTAEAPLVFAVDVAPDRRDASIAVCGRRSADARLHVKIVDFRDGSYLDWLIERVVEVSHTYRPAAILIDPAGPAGSLIAELTEKDVTITSVTAREMAQACGAFHDDAVTDKLRHLNQEPLNAAVRSATTRTLGEAWAWDRRKSDVSISPLVAATLAAYGFRTLTAAPEPWISFG